MQWPGTLIKQNCSNKNWFYDIYSFAVPKLILLACYLICETACSQTLQWVVKESVGHLIFPNRLHWWSPLPPTPGAVLVIQYCGYISTLMGNGGAKVKYELLSPKVVIIASVFLLYYSWFKCFFKIFLLRKPLYIISNYRVTRLATISELCTIHDIPMRISRKRGCLLIFRVGGCRRVYCLNLCVFETYLLVLLSFVVRVAIWSASTTCCTSGNLPSSVEGIFFALSRRVLATESLCWVVGVFNEDTNITVKWFTEGSSENVHIWKLTKN